jgi:two-component system sensor histidine kinase EvgS
VTPCAPGVAALPVRRWLSTRLRGLAAAARRAGAALLLVAGAAQAQPAPPSSAAAAASAAYFRVPRLAVPLALGPEVLTPQERAFVAALPELRVAIPVPPARPYEDVAADGEVSGIHPEMLSYLARAFGLRVRPVLLPGWSAALGALERREADLIMSIGYTAERARYLSYTLGVTPLPGALFTRAATGAQGAVTESQLASGRFVIERDFLAANDFVRRQYPQASILTVDDHRAGAARGGRRPCRPLPGQPAEAIDWLAREPVAGIEINRLLPYGGGHYHFAVRKDWAPLADVLNKGIQTLRAQGLTPPRRPRLGAATASLPAARRCSPLRLAAREAGLLVQRPVWRVGGARAAAAEPPGAQRACTAALPPNHRAGGAAPGRGMQVVGFDTVGDDARRARRGDIDLVPFLTRTPAARTEFDFSRTYVEMPYVIVARSDGRCTGTWTACAASGWRWPQHPLRPLVLNSATPTSASSTWPMRARRHGRRGRPPRRRGGGGQAVRQPAHQRRRRRPLRTVAVVDEVPAQFHFATRQSGQRAAALVDRALQDIPEDEALRMRRRWVAVDLDPPFPWRRWMPLLAVAGTAVLLLAAVTAWWVQRLSREVKARRRSEERLRDIGNTLPCVAFRHVLSADGGTLVASWTSSRTEALLGFLPTAGQTVLAALAARLAPADADTLTNDERRCLADSGRLRRTVQLDGEGGRRWFTCEAVCTPAEAGLKAWTGYIVDTTHERELQAQLVDAAQNRNLMLASASHELRAPAHTLALALQALPAQGLSPAQERSLRIARDAVDSLSQLLGDVLDAARFDGAPLRLRARDTALHELLHRLAEGASANAASKGLSFVQHVDPALPPRVHLDPLRLRQVVVNLLSNAFKYTPAGRVELLALRRPGPDGTAELAITVADTGPGIAPELSQRLFTPFATAGGEASSGLGLAISRQLAERMGGRLELVSQPGQGTRATVVLPLVEAGPAPEAPPRQGVVLVCDDDVTSRLLLAHVLRSRGYEVAEVERAEDALQRCRAGGVAAVVTDLEMPGLGGLGLLRALRADAGGPAAPALVVCSGDNVDLAGSIDTRELADARLVKPVDLGALVQTLAALGVHPADPGAG